MPQRDDQTPPLNRQAIIEGSIVQLDEDLRRSDAAWRKPHRLPFQ